MIMWKVKCPACNEPTGVTGALLQLEAAPRKIECQCCGAINTTNYEARLHLTGYRMLALSITFGALAGALLVIPNIPGYVHREMWLTGIVESCVYILLTVLIAATMLGLPGFFYVAPTIQKALDAVGLRADEPALKSPQRRKRPPALEVVEPDTLAFDVLVSPRPAKAGTHVHDQSIPINQRQKSSDLYRGLQSHSTFSHRLPSINSSVPTTEDSMDELRIPLTL